MKNYISKKQRQRLRELDIKRTEYEIFCLDEKQGDKLIKEW